MSQLELETSQLVLETSHLELEMSQLVLQTSQLVLETSQSVLDTPGQLKRHNSSRWGFPGDSVYRICLQCRSCRRLEFDPWFGKIHALEEGMIIPSSILAWRVPWIEEPGGLQSIGLQRVRRD